MGTIQVDDMRLVLEHLASARAKAAEATGALLACPTAPSGVCGLLGSLEGLLDVVFGILANASVGDVRIEPADSDRNIRRGYEWPGSALRPAPGDVGL